MIQILLIVLVMAFGQEIENEPNCPEGTILHNDICTRIGVENCADNPYDYYCGIADLPQDNSFGVIIAALVISVIFIMTLIMWMKKK